MPAAKTKADLIAVTKKEWEKLAKPVANIDENTASLEDGGGSSATRIVAQPGSICTSHGEGMPRPEPPLEMPAPGYEWNKLKALNEAIFQNQKGWTWSATYEVLEGAHLRLLAEIRGVSETEIYGQSLAPSLKWTRGRLCRSGGHQSYRFSAKVLRKLKKDLNSG